MTTPIEKSEHFRRIADDVFEPLQRYLRRRASPADAEDAFADTLVTIWRRLEDAPTDNVLPWSYGIARRVLANQRRGNQRRLRLLERLSSQRTEPHRDPADVGDDPGLSLILELLSVSDREILRLWAWEQLEPREIAVVLGITPNAASLRLSRAKKSLAGLMARQDEEHPGHRGLEGTRGASA